jgi:hypothetical protein
MNHQVGRWVFALGVGVLVALLSYRWITNPQPRVERQLQEAVVLSARDYLAQTTGIVAPEIVDPLAPDRKIGKVYIYRSDTGWEVSGYYRRNKDDKWHPFLMSLDSAPTMTHLRVQDAALAGTDNALLEVLP